MFVPFERMRERLAIESQDSDATLSLASLYFGELVLKLTTIAVVSAVRDDVDRHRYRQCHRIVRADGLGEWNAALRDVVTGPGAHFLDPIARTDARELIEKKPQGTPINDATKLLYECHALLQIEGPGAGINLSYFQWADAFVLLRNKTRGHGALRSSLLANVSSKLCDSINLIISSLTLFKRPWAYIKRNISGKYRVTTIADDTACFAELRSRADKSLVDGIYVMFENMCRVELIYSDPELSDFFLPNGGFTETRFEALSLITGDIQHIPSTPYLIPVDKLPPSETQGLGILDVRGKCFCNLPPEPAGYVKRDKLEVLLRNELAQQDRHPIVSLTGPGGIGKTSTTLRVLYGMAMEESPPYSVIIWFSARDIDLLPQGAKTVRPAGVSLRDFADMFVTLVEPTQRLVKGFKPTDFLAAEMCKPSCGPTLFVFDNFETVAVPGELFSWIDSMIRPPNKVLITTRIRGDFRADFPVQVTGMDETEGKQLIDNVSSSLHITHLISDAYRQEIIDESDGHPYVIKVLLGEVAKAGACKKIERIVADRDEILLALFERTYAALRPFAQRVFLVLSNWRSMVPKIAVEAVILRPANEKIDVVAAIEELLQSSLVDEIKSEDGDVFLSVPLASAIFGQRKLGSV